MTAVGTHKKNSKKPACRVQRPKAVDLFAGCGGLTQGLKQAGYNVIGAVDVDPLAVETYRLNHPSVHSLRMDITKLSTKSFMRLLHIKRGELDLLAGCPPCQGFSALRTLNGSKEVTDERNELIYDFYRFVKDMRPRIVMMENVPALATDQRLKNFCDRLSKLGYRYEVRVLNAADYGVPQRRRRMILLASLKGKCKFAQTDPIRRTVRDAIQDLPQVGRSGDRLHDILEERSPEVMKLISSIPHNGGSRLSLGPDKQLKCHTGFDGFKDIYGRMAWDDVSPTITSGCTNPSKGRFLHPELDRAITPREAALLQTFPKNYKFSLRKGKSGAATLIGNALPPEFIKRHAIQLLSILPHPKKKVNNDSN